MEEQKNHKSQLTHHRKAGRKLSISRVPTKVAVADNESGEGDKAKQGKRTNHNPEKTDEKYKYFFRKNG